MRYFHFLLLLIFVTSCAHNNIRFVKTKTRPAVIVENEMRTAESDLKIEDSKNLNPSIESTTSDKNLVVPADPKQNDEEISPSNSDREYPTQLDDTITKPSDQEIYHAAKSAEKRAVNSKTLFITSIVMLILPIVGVLSLIPFILGCVYLMKANRSAYITPMGEEASEKAGRLRLVYIILVAIMVILIAVALAFF